MSQDGDHTIFSLAHITSDEKVITATKSYGTLYYVYGFRDGNIAAALKEYQRRCPDQDRLCGRVVRVPG
jgi:hypothetical protein